MSVTILTLPSPVYFLRILLCFCIQINNKQPRSLSIICRDNAYVFQTFLIISNSYILIAEQYIEEENPHYSYPNYLSKSYRHVNFECGVDKQFSCPVCPRTFSRKSNMKRHAVNVHEILLKWKKRTALTLSTCYSKLILGFLCQLIFILMSFSFKCNFPIRKIKMIFTE